MKKLALVCLVAIILSCSFGTLAEREIAFRQLPWFSTRQEVEKALLTDGAKHVNYSKTPQILRININDLENLFFSTCTRCGFMESYEGITTVAGYDVEALSVAYLYPLISNQVIVDENLAEFYMGVYGLSPSGFSFNEDIYNDLTLKLSFLYGDYVTSVVDESFGVSAGRIQIWTDPNDNFVFLAMSDDNALIIYYAGDANSRLDALQYNSADSLEGL